MAEEQNATPAGNPETLQDRIINAAYAFADVLRQDADPMLDEHTNVKLCRTLIVATAKLLESIGHHPVIKVRVDKEGRVYHYFLEDSELGISIDYFPMSHFRGFKEESVHPSDSLLDVLARETLVLPLDSAEHKKILGVGRIEVREKGRTSDEIDKQGGYTWDHILLDRTPDTIKEKLEALRQLSIP